MNSIGNIEQYVSPINSPILFLKFHVNAIRKMMAIQYR